ncbi:MAG: right-handed parallel beta-helix repeat-containing protein [Lachnospiraceae bacterium]|nr:right-handed parallel beta-helix repeat-containing protein [Lachnospiraceae bacterium]
MKIKEGIRYVAAAMLVFAGVTALTALTTRAADGDDARTVVEVGTTGEFMEAIGDDKTIVLAPGDYNLTEWLNETELTPWDEGTKESGLYLEEEYEGPALFINGYENLAIVSSDGNDPARIICEPGHANVINFVNCEHILLDSLSLGHYPEKGECSGSVLYFESSEHVTVANCELYGCGVYGLVTDNCENITLLDCDVHDCSYGCVWAENSDNFSFIHTDFHDCTGICFTMNGADTKLIGCNLENLQGGLGDTDKIYMVGTGIKNSFEGEDWMENPGETEEPAEPEKKEEPEKPAEPEKKEESEKPAEPEKKEESEKPAEPDNKTESDNKSEPGKAETADTELISYTAKSHPMELKDEDRVLAGGNYYELILSAEDKEKYPELSGEIDRLNQAEEKDLNGFFENYEAEIQEFMANTGNDAAYSSERYLMPLRADSLVFSFAISDYEFLGGAHGSTTYRTFNYDPKTGKSIAFSDVVKDTDGLPTAVFKELSQSEDYSDYYKEYPDGEKELYDALGSKLESGGEGLLWALDYEGLWVFFDNYEIGPYAMGAPSALITFKDYPELFSDQYIYKGALPEEDSNMTFEKDAPLKTVNSKTHEARLLPICWSQEGFWPEEEQDYGDGYSYYTYTDLYKLPKDQYPELSERLEEINSGNLEYYSESLPLFKEEIERTLEDTPDEWQYYSRGADYVLCRADDRILSFVMYSNFSGIGSDPESTAQGINIDTGTGLYVDLYDVIVSGDALTKAFEEELSDNETYVDEWKDIAKDLLKSALTDDVIYSGAESGLNFTVDYQGLTLYFNGDDTGFDDGPCTVCIGYQEYPGVFKDKYSHAPLNYSVELASGDFSYIYWFDFNADGNPDPVSLIRGEGDWDDWYKFSLYLDGTVTELEDMGNFFDANAFLMHDNGTDYIYIEATTENDYQTVHVYEIGPDGAEYKGCCDGALKFMVYPDDEDESEGYIPVNPRGFKLEVPDYTLGTNWLIGDYVVSNDGMPYQTEYFADYLSTYWGIKAAKDIDAKYTTDDSLPGKDGTIKKGTVVRPDKKSMGNDLNLETEDGKIWHLQLEEKDHVYYYNGEDLDVLFEGQVYAG